MSGITLLGLGPGDPSKLTREAWEVLSSADEIWLRTSQHPAVAGLPSTLKVFSFDELYEKGESFEAVYAAIVEKVLELGGASRVWSTPCRATLLWQKPLVQP